MTNPPQNTPQFLPILLRLREVYKLIPFGQSFEGQTEKSLALSDLILQHLAQQPIFQKLKPSRQWLENHFEQGKFLVLLDGLDEIPKIRREVVREWIDKQMKVIVIPNLF